MISVSSKTTNLQIQSKRLQKAVDETVNLAESVVGQIETLATFAKASELWGQAGGVSRARGGLEVRDS